MQACMSLRPASQEQLDLIAAKLDLQAAEIAAFRERVAVLEAEASGASQGFEFELVSAAPPLPKASGSQVLLSFCVSEERREIASGIGPKRTFPASCILL